MPKRFAFVNYGNSREGSAIADALKEEGYFVYATRRPDPQKLDHLNPDPLSVDQFIDSDPDTIVETMKTCHAVIYTILDTPKLAVEVLTKLSQDIGVKKTVIIVSPIFTWAGEPRAEDWKKRWANPKYTDHLAAERYLTTLPLRLFVMCTGLLYGEGENVLLPIFQSAWKLNPVPVLEQNHNVIPTLHVRDMARGAVSMIENRPSVPVIVAHDGSNTNQRELIRAINSAFGAGKTPKRTDDEIITAFGREAYDWLKIDLEIEAEDFSGLDFERHCTGGPVEEIQTLVDEFVSKRLLTPLRICAFGIPQNIINQIVEYYGVVNLTKEKILELFAADRSEEAVEIRESGNEEEEAPYADIERHVLANCPAVKNLGYIITSVPEDEEAREALFLEDEEPAPYMPKYIITSSEYGPLERWFISKGSHCTRIAKIEDVKKFLGLPRNFTREVRILEARRKLEAIQSEEADARRKAIKREKEQEEARLQALIARDAELLKECEAELQSMAEIRAMHPREYLMQRVVPMFMPPLAQVNEARPDDPLRFLASHFESEAARLEK